MNKDFKWTIRLSLVTPIIMFLAILMAGGGHGNMGPIFLMFPVAFAIKLNNDIYSMALMAIQFPIYGLIIDLSNRFFNTKLYGVALLVIMHIITIMCASKNSFLI